MDEEKKFDFSAITEKDQETIVDLVVANDPKDDSREKLTGELKGRELDKYASDGV